MIGKILLLLALAQQQQPASAPYRVEGRVVRGRRDGQQPIPGQWVVLHRVGHDRQGPIDSVKTGANGQFKFTYRPSGDTTALYFATTAFGGIVYPTSPFHAQVVSGDDAMITVFDTTSGPVRIGVSGRHLVVGAPNEQGRRPVGEVYDLENDSVVTAIARDSVTPVFAVHIPEEAVEFRVNTNGDLAEGAAVRRGSSVGLYAPLSPGIRQFAFTYELPRKAFPLKFPIERPTVIMEVLIQEPTGRVTGANFREAPSENAEGRVFRRFLAEDVPSSALITVDLPRFVAADRRIVYYVMGGIFVVAMAAAIFFAARRAGVTRRTAGTEVERPSTVLVRSLAELDEQFEREPGDDSVRSLYEQERARLKQQLAEALTAERQR